MLILPAERQLDWKRPPWITLALILLNVLVFTLYQSDDEELIRGALDTYQQEQLLELEVPVYENYLRRQANLHGNDDALEQLDAIREAAEEGQDLMLSFVLLQDRDFYAYARENGDRYWQPEDRTRWQQAREQIQSRYLDHLSSLRFGLKPYDVQAADLVVYQFLHGGWGHLIGNMIILFLLGFTVEQALGGPRYILAYLLCGVASGLLFALVEGFDGPPLVGASGSISGLMGMYIAIYGRQRIRFFYFVGFYFNYLRAPALLMLPVWAIKEIWDYFMVEGSSVAYMAHLGGLLAGAGMVGLFGRSWLQVRKTFHEAPEDEQEAQFRRAYAMAMGSLERFQFQQARLQFEALWRQYPERSVLLEHLYQLAKLRPQEPEYQVRCREMLELALRQNRFNQVVEVWEEHQKLASDAFPLGAADHNRVLFMALREGDMKTAEKAFARLQACGEALLIEEARRLMVAEMDKRQLGTRAEKYRKALV